MQISFVQIIKIKLAVLLRTPPHKCVRHNQTERSLEKKHTIMVNFAKQRMACNGLCSHQQENMPMFCPFYTKQQNKKKKKKAIHFVAVKHNRAVFTSIARNHVTETHIKHEKDCGSQCCIHHILSVNKNAFEYKIDKRYRY